MNTKSKIYSLCLLSSIIMACSNDQNSGGDKKEKSSEESLLVFDAKAFKNTKSKEEAFKKADESHDIINGISAKNNQFKTNLKSQLAPTAAISSNREYTPRNNYDFANFRSCDEVISEYESQEVTSFEVDCMRQFDLESGLYQPTRITFIDGSYYYSTIHFMTFKKDESGKFIEAPLFPEDINTDNNSTIDTNDSSEPQEKPTSGFEQSSTYEFDFQMMLGDFQENLDDCDSAYQNFKSTYIGMESNLNDVVSMIKQPGALNLASKAPKDAKTSELKETELDQQSASKLSFGNVEEDIGLSSDGFVSLGADDSKVLARMQLNISQDTKKFSEFLFKFDEEMFDTNPPQMPQFPQNYYKIGVDMTFGADLEQRVLEMTVLSNESISGEQTATMNMNGVITVSDKEENRYIKKLISVNSASSEFGAVALAYDATTTLKDDDTIENIGAITLNGEVTKYNYKIYKDESGKCMVSKDFGKNIKKVVEFLAGEKTETDEMSPKG